MTMASNPLQSQFGRLVGPDAISPELTGRLRRLADVLDRIAAGTAPTPSCLRGAPLLVEWRLEITWNRLCLVGFCVGHPLYGSKEIATSQLLALDPQHKWARTISLFYRLGVRRDGVVARDNQDRDAT